MDKITKGKRLEIAGMVISTGIAIGKVYILKQIDLDAVAGNKFPLEDIIEEQKRLEKAVSETRSQLIKIQSQITNKTNQNIGNIFNAHISFLEDKYFLKEIIDVLIKEEVNVEYIVANQIKKLQDKFSNIEQEMTRERFIDIQDVYHRLLRNLLEIEHVRTNLLKRIDEPVIIVAEKLIPSDIALFDPDKILGIIIEEGSTTSHVSIISRSLGVPSIIKLPGISTIVNSKDTIIIDAYSSKVIINPASDEIKYYHKKREEQEIITKQKLQSPQKYDCKTKDGVEIRLDANVSSVQEAKLAFLYGANSIGLLRTEFFYMSLQQLPELKAELEFYQQIINEFKNRTVTVRLLDLGTEKTPSYLRVPLEENPQLGCRGIRYLLKFQEILKRQLDSIIMASEFGKVKILLPFITIVEDLEETLEIINDLCEKNKCLRDNISIGIMVETPSVALDIESFIDKIDFISIGTNDLTQYIFAASREEPTMENYRQAVHPVILRLIKNIVMSAEIHQKEVSVCGEIASDPISACLLIGLGVRILSMQPESIPLVKEELEKHTINELVNAAGKAINYKNAKEVMNELSKI
ncbi:MAG: phosphoenolpyruvate--protein phosphotransferase [Elusimicrobiota bacterium]